MENDDIDMNVNNYSQDDLLSLLSLNNIDIDTITYEDIINASNPLIQRDTREDNYDLANFFQQAQNKLLEDIDDDDIDNIQNLPTYQL